MTDTKEGYNHWDLHCAEFLQAWKKAAEDDNKELQLFIGVDTGATNTRVSIGNQTDHKSVATLNCKSVSKLISALKEVGERLEELGYAKYIKAGCIAVAGPVQNGSFVKITNYDSGETDLKLEDLPTTLFPTGHARIINDLESACFGIAALEKEETLCNYFGVLSGNCKVEMKKQHSLVIAVGTGMGTGLLLAKGDDFIVLPLEGGHVLLAPSSNKDSVKADEEDMLKFLGDKLYDGKYSIEYEDIISGRGLVALYEWVTHDKPDAPKNLTAKDVGVSAQDGSNEYATKALKFHYHYLARGAANLAVLLGAKGVFFAGDNLLANYKFVEANAKSIHEEFLNHPKKSWIENVPLFAQTKSISLNIEGTLHLSRNVLTTQYL